MDIECLNLNVILNGKMRNKKVYLKLILMYSAVFMIPLILNIVMLNDAIKREKQQIRESLYTGMKASMAYLEEQFSILDMYVESLSDDYTIRQVSSWKDLEKYHNISKLKTIHTNMKTLKSSSFMDECYLYFRNSNLVISSKRIFLEEDSVRHFFDLRDMGWEKWMDKVNNSHVSTIFPEMVIKNGNSEESAIIYIQPLVNENGLCGRFVFSIPSEMIYRSILSTGTGAGISFLLMDREGRILASFGTEDEETLLLDNYETGKAFQEIRTEGEVNDLIILESEKQELSLVAIVPHSYVGKQIRVVQRRNYLFLFIVLFLGVFGILLFSWRRGRVIDNILQSIKNAMLSGKSEYKGDELTFISSFLNQQIVTNTELHEIIKNQEPVIRKLLIEKLLHGNEYGIETIMNRYGLVFPEKRGGILIFQIVPRQHDDAYMTDIIVHKSIFSGHLDKLLPGTKYYCDTEVEETAVICDCGRDFQKNREQLLDRLTRLSDEYMSENRVKIKIVLSKEYDSIEQIGSVYEQAREMLQWGRWESRVVLDAASSHNNTDRYYYPLFCEENLTNSIKEGDEERVRRIMMGLCNTNIDNLALDHQMCCYFLNDIQCTIIKVLNELNIGQEKLLEFLQVLTELTDESDIRKRFDMNMQVMIKLCGYIHDNKGTYDESNNLKDEIENYIRCGFVDKNMSLKKIAADFGYESTYFSKLFKDIFDENFGGYLERIRMDAVCEMLEKGEILECIAEQCGYSSVAVMREAFKRVKGMTPKAYRELYFKNKK